MAEADADQPLQVVVFNVGANVNFPILDTTERVFRKVWEMACEGGFLTGREAARRMLARGSGSIFFTGATASMRGGAGYAAFASAKAGLAGRGPVDGAGTGSEEHPCRAPRHRFAGVDTSFVRERIVAARGPKALEQLAPDTLMDPASIAEAYWRLHQQTRDGWTFELDLRPYRRNMVMSLSRRALPVRFRQSLTPICRTG